MNQHALLKQIRQCTLCQHQLPLPAKPILQYSANSKILIAGQAPGAVTHEQGIPFDDKSGERLRDWLGVSKETFYDDNQCAIVPMGFCYPGKGKSGDLPPIPLCAQTWRNAILTEINHIQLTILIGKYAIDWHIDRINNASSTKANIQYKTITELVERWQELLTHNTIALPHPSPRNNIWLKKNPWFEQDILPLLKQRVSDALN